MFDKTACSRSWTDVNINFRQRKVANCCKSTYHTMPDDYTQDFFDNSEFVQQRRSDSLKGIMHSDCEACWRDVRKGQRAHIDWWNTWVDFSEEKPNVPKVEAVEFELDSTCDLSCLYCSYDTSSKIAQEEGREIVDNISQHDIEMSKKYLKQVVENCTQDVLISFSGGEPTSSKHFYKLMEFINTLDTSKIRLDVITNGNSKPFLFEKFVNEIDKFKGQITISISNESFQEDSELIRWGLDWERFEQNIRAYAAHDNVSKINLGINVSNISLRSFSEYLIWIYNTMSEYDVVLNLCGDVIDSPHELDVEILPESCKEYVDPAIKFFSELQPNKDFYDKDKFLGYLNELKDRVGSNYKKDYKEVIGNFLKEKERVKNTDKLNKLLNF